MVQDSIPNRRNPNQIVFSSWGAAGLPVRYGRKIYKNRWIFLTKLLSLGHKTRRFHAKCKPWIRTDRTNRVNMKFQWIFIDRKKGKSSSITFQWYMTFTSPYTRVYSLKFQCAVLFQTRGTCFIVHSLHSLKATRI